MASTGVGTGIGIALGEIGDALERRKERQLQARDQQADTLVNQMHAIRDNISRVGVDSPEGQQLSTQLKSTIEQHNALYAPHETPALVARVQKLFGKQPAAPRPDPRSGLTFETEMATAPQQKTEWQRDKDFPFKTSGGVVYEHQINSQTGEERFRPLAGMNPQDLRPAGTESLSQEDYAEAQRIKAGLEPKAATRKFTDDQIAAAAKAYSDWGLKPSATLAPAVAEYMQANGMTPLDTTKGVRAFTKTQDGRFVSVLLNPKTNQIIPGSENPNIPPPPGLQGRISTGFFHWVDEKGLLHEIQETRTSAPIGATGGGGAGAPPKAGAGAPTPKRDTIIGTKATPAYNKANTEYAEAVKASTQADEAAKARSSVQDKLLIETLVKGASGRFSQASYNNLVEKTGLANKLNQFYNNVVGGGQLPDDVRQQAVDAAHAMVRDADAARKAVAPPSIDTDVDAVLEELRKLK